MGQAEEGVHVVTGLRAVVAHKADGAQAGLPVPSLHEHAPPSAAWQRARKGAVLPTPPLVAAARDHGLVAHGDRVVARAVAAHAGAGEGQESGGRSTRSHWHQHQQHE